MVGCLCLFGVKHAEDRSSRNVRGRMRIDRASTERIKSDSSKFGTDGMQFASSRTHRNESEHFPDLGVLQVAQTRQQYEDPCAPSGC